MRSRLIIRLLCLALAAAPAAAQTSGVRQKLAEARKLVLSGRAAEAIPIYEELLRAAPDNPGLMMNLAVARFKAGRYEEVIPLCRRILETRPGAAGAWLFLGAAHFQLGRYGEAVEPLRKALAAKPGERNARLMLGEALLQLDRPQQAVAELERVAELLPSEPRVWYGLERGYTLLAERAERRLERAAPGSAYWHAAAGDLFFRREDYGRALHHYRQALQLRPDFPGLHDAIAALYRAAGKPEWARTEEAKAAQNPPNCTAEPGACDVLAGKFAAVARRLAGETSPASLYWLAVACRKRARHAFARLESLPESEQLHELRARRFDELARYRQAAAEWRKALALSPANPVFMKGLAVSLFEDRDLDAALSLFEKLAARTPEDPEIPYFVGRILLDQGRPADALPHLRRAVELDAARARFQAALGEALLKTGRAAEAVAHLKAASEADEDGSFHFQLARAYQTNGQRDLAREAIEKYRELRREAEARQKELDRQYPVEAP